MLKRGFTIMELLVALMLLSVVLLFVFSTFTYQHGTYTVVDQVSESQQNSRAIARLIERDIRNSGYLVPAQAAACGIDSVSGPDMLFVSDTDAINWADSLDQAFASGNLGGRTSGTNADPSTTGSVTITVDSIVLDGVASYDTNGDGTNDSDFRVNNGAILIDRGNPDRGVACGIVTGVPSSTSVTVNLSSVLNTSGSTVTAAKDTILVPAHVYQIVAGPPPQLQRDGQLLAKDVEDFQLAWFYDDNDDGDMDSGELRAATGTTPFVANTVNGAELREIRIDLVMRTRTDDPRTETNFSIGQARENRTTASVPVADGKHRSVHIANVRLRNLSL